MLKTLTEHYTKIIVIECTRARSKTRKEMDQKHVFHHIYECRCTPILSVGLLLLYYNELCICKRSKLKCPLIKIGVGDHKPYYRTVSDFFFIFRNI